jgi:hypothetical protein
VVVRFALETLRSRSEAFDITAKTSMTVFPLLTVRVKLENPSTPASADVVAKATAEATNTKALFIFNCLQAMLILVRETSEETYPTEREGKVR